jgi:hypothetical protein
MQRPFRRSPIFLLGGLAFSILCAYYLAEMILTGDSTGLIFVALTFVVSAGILAMLKDWRTGTFIFFGWLFVEDLARKYMGNNMAIYFGKDVLVAVVYLSFFIAWRRKQATITRPPFLIPVLLFLWFGLIQVFNPASTSFYYGILGMKLYFYYVPLFFIGYAFFESEEDINRFYPFLMSILLVVAGLGIAQSILGPTFLNPSTLQEDIRELSTTYRVAPISGLIAYRPTSVFVSTGRFAFMLTPAWLFAFGYCVYLLLRSKRYRILAFLALGFLSVAVAMCASRGTFMWTIGSAICCVPALIWGCPWQKGQLVRILRSFQRALMIVVLGIFVMFLVYPDAIKARMSVYQETLDPSSPASEIVHRTQVYPLQQLMYAFDYPRWPYGYGIGTASLGTQYIIRIMHAPPMNIGVESGFGGMILELGIAGLFLFLLMAGSIVFHAGRVVLKLRNTPWFPLGFVIFWYSILFLFLYLWTGLQQFQDFILNSFLWFSLGILFRLRTYIRPAQQAVANATPAPARRVAAPDMA